MAEDLIRYDILAQEALRGVVRKVLSEVVKTGLPGDHHFFISFVTRAPGVRLSERLLGQYDKEMTIVLQNQFWDLKVNETGFEVGLSFDGQPEMLVVPFSAIKGFFDPSVQFGLQFETAETAAADAEPVTAEVEKVAPPTPPESTDNPDDDGGDDHPREGAQVVRLDRFRKK